MVSGCIIVSIGRLIFVMTLKFGRIQMFVGECSPVFLLTSDLDYDMTMIRRDYVLVRPMAWGYILIINMIISRN